ncbi:two-component response regulator [Indibacter alkaliphilus LW1]|uniref:Two-component response regulator n=1 Tax=Indibacter alkaliphilus (strain CCUG 57479 / KCTC 22604 / LW1) TaxID=1189612 RepID=S2DJH1_INDAL|nr:response regulator transcription factor [Indibacter alkaliphilus]EOZ99229.1 two-component response regulator [Indibacter alkaliphilus LW1]
MKVLLIEDNKEMILNIIKYLSQEGMICEVAENLFDAQDKILSFEYDCILLDLTLPDGNGLSLLKELKRLESKPDVLIISAKNSLEDKLLGLDLGADDYLPKPFHLAELLARIKAIYRRTKLGGTEVLVFEEIQVQYQNLLASVHGKQLDLTKKEFDLLVFLITNKNRVLGKSAIAQHLWGDYTDNLSNFDFVYQHIKNLRKKIAEAGGRDYLSTVYGIGYKFGANQS